MVHLKNNTWLLSKDGNHLIHSTRQCQEILEPHSACPCRVTFDMLHPVGTTLGRVLGDKDESMTSS